MNERGAGDGQSSRETETLQTLHGRETPASTQRRAFWLPSRGRPGYSCGTAPALHRTSPISASPLQTRPSAAHSVVRAHYHGALRWSKTRAWLATTARFAPFLTMPPIWTGCVVCFGGAGDGRAEFISQWQEAVDARNSASQPQAERSTPRALPPSYEDKAVDCRHSPFLRVASSQPALSSQPK